MMPRFVRISTPCRLHFGLLSFNRSHGRNYGGMGVMLQEPRTVISIEASPTMSATGPNADRALQFAQAWAEHTKATCRGKITIERTIPSHVGLGSGTQLALAIAEGLWRLLPSRRRPTLSLLAGSVGRARRSSIGTFGFAEGGFISEQGRLAGEPLGRLNCRIDFPSQWCVLLVRRTYDAGLSGHHELNAFARLPSVPTAVSSRLDYLMQHEVIPALKEADFSSFSSAVYDYGRISGNCFAPVQGGPFAGESVTRLVETIRELGVSGVGQSSWGPTVFAFVPSHVEALELKAKLLLSSSAHGPLDIQLTRGDNEGALITDVTPPNSQFSSAP